MHESPFCEMRFSQVASPMYDLSAKSLLLKKHSRARGTLEKSSTTAQ